MSRLRRPFLYDRHLLVTVDLLRSRSPGLALKPCGLSTSGGLFRAAQSASRWKSRNAGKRALRYISLAWMPPNRRGGAGWPLIACVGQPMRRGGFEAASCDPTNQVRVTLVVGPTEGVLRARFCAGFPTVQLVSSRNAQPDTTRVSHGGRLDHRNAEERSDRP